MEQMLSKKLECMKTAVWEVKNRELTQELKIPEGMPDVGRILGSWGQLLIRGKQWQSDSISVSGGVMLSLLYEPEDGSSVRTLESWIPFQCKWELPETKRDGVILVRGSLRDTDARSIGAGKLMTTACISLIGEAAEPVSLEVPQPEKLPEDICTLVKKYPLCLPVEAGERSVNLVETISLDTPVRELVALRLLPLVKEQKVMGERMVFRGSAVAQLLFLDPNGILTCRDHELPFSQYVDLQRPYGPDCEGVIHPVLNSLEAKALEDGTVSLEAQLLGQYMLYDKTVLSVLEDAYSPCRQVELSHQQLQLPAVLEQREDSLEARLQLEEGQPVWADFMYAQPVLRSQEDGFSGELEGSFRVLYYDGEGKLQQKTAPWQDAFSLAAASQTQLRAQLQQLEFPQLQGDQVITPLSAFTQTLSQTPLEAVTDIRFGECLEPDPQRPSLILRKCGSESLWELAKRCGTTPEAISRANGLEGEPQGDGFLLIPVP